MGRAEIVGMFRRGGRGPESGICGVGCAWVGAIVVCATSCGVGAGEAAGADWGVVGVFVIWRTGNFILRKRGRINKYRPNIAMNIITNIDP